MSTEGLYCILSKSVAVLLVAPTRDVLEMRMEMNVYGLSHFGFQVELKTAKITHICSVCCIDHEFIILTGFSAT